MTIEFKLVPVQLTSEMRQATQGASCFDEAWQMALAAAPEYATKMSPAQADATHRHKRTGFGYRNWDGGWQVFNGSYWVLSELENAEQELEPFTCIDSEPVQFAILVSVYGDQGHDYKVSCVALCEAGKVARRAIYDAAIKVMIAYSVRPSERMACRAVYLKSKNADLFMREMCDGYGSIFQRFLP